MPHWHIRWSSKTELDWEAFDTRGEAEKSAAQLVRPGETYTIVESDGTCLRCQVFTVKTGEPDGNPKPKYPWQRAVLDAFESSPESLPFTVNAAERVIAARLRDKSHTSVDERLALNSALRSLRNLLPDEKRSADSAGKMDIA
jgi:hypothetical protein